MNADARTHQVRLQFRVLDSGDVEINGTQFRVNARVHNRGTFESHFCPRKFRKVLKSAGHAVPRGMADIGASWQSVVDIPVNVVLWKTREIGGQTVGLCADMWPYTGSEDDGKDGEPYEFHGEAGYYVTHEIAPFPCDPNTYTKYIPA